jgi:hypothetical protein
MSTFGVTLTTQSGFTESVDVEKKAEHKQLLQSDGRHGEAYAYDTIYTFSARGKGDNPFSAGPGTGGLQVEGASFITSCKTTTKNDDWQGWEISGTAYAHAGN